MATFWRSLARLRTYAFAHKVLSAVVAVTVLGGGYWTYAHVTGTTTQTRYILGTVQRQTIVAAVTGSGQVSPSHQVTINPKASGQITRVLARSGAAVRSGQVLAYIDATDQVNAVATAKADLESAQLSLQKIKEPADTLSVTQAQNALSQSRTSLAKDYDDGYNEVASTFATLPAVMTGLKNVLFAYDRSLGAPSVDNIDYYRNQILDTRATTFHDDATQKYQTALDTYNTSLDLYKSTPRTAATSSIVALLDSSYATTKYVADAVQSSNSLIQLYKDDLTARGITPASVADTHITSLNTYTTQLSSHISNLLTVKTAIVNDGQSITEKSQSLDKLNAGADPLDVQSSQLTIEQRQNALKQAQDNLADYSIIAPFTGTLAGFNIRAGDNVTTGTTIATLITPDYIADLSLNEVDAAKIALGQKATLTFDAIDGLSLTGDIVYVSPLGSVSQGVVSYEVQIDFATQDPRVKAGMTINADIQIATAQNVLSVPSSAIKTQNGQTYVQTFTPSLPDTGGSTGTVSPTAPANSPVVIGIADDTNTEIRSGLTEGQQIVVRTTTGSAASAAARTTTTGGAGGTRGFGGGPAIRL